MENSPNRVCLSTNCDAGQKHREGTNLAEAACDRQSLWLGDLPMIKRVRPPSASEDISGEASMLPIIARVLAEEGSGGGDLRWRDKSQTIAIKARKANAMNR